MLVFFLQSCIKKDCQIAGGQYEFEIPATFSPARDTFYVGDTITVTSAFSSEVYERETDTWYKLENFRFFPETSIHKIDTIGKIDDFSEFDVILSSQYNYQFINYSDGGQTLSGEYNYLNNNYDLQWFIKN